MEPNGLTRASVVRMDHYSLGRFVSSREAELIALMEQAGRMRSSDLLRRLTAITSDRTPKPDVLEVLTPWDPDRGWLASLLQAVEQLTTEGCELELLECVHQPGFDGEAAAAFVDRARTRSVREGDDVQAGFLVLRAQHRLLVFPRVVRKVCSNGAIMALKPEVAYQVAEDEVAGAVRACLEPGPFELAVQQFCVAAQRVVDDVPQLQGWARTVATAEELEPTAKRPDRTLFGVLNNATSRGHGVARWSERVQHEQDAARLLQSLRVDVHGEGFVPADRAHLAAGLTLV
jgi:hypothetical protein